MYGLIGRRLDGSFSRKIFAEWGFDYRNFELSDIGELPALLAAEPSLEGFNVTAPYKIDVLRYLDAVDPVAEAVGAVNCVVRARTGQLSGQPSGRPYRLIGYNTDALALREIFAKLSIINYQLSIILGTGGAARAARWALEQNGAAATMVSRKRHDAEQGSTEHREGRPAAGSGGVSYGPQASPPPHSMATARKQPVLYSALTPEIIAAHTLIINATPNGEPPIPYDALTPAHTLFDMTYNPPETPFLRHGHLRGARTINGLGMLQKQAELSLRIWRDKSEEILHCATGACSG